MFVLFTQTESFQPPHGSESSTQNRLLHHRHFHPSSPPAEMQCTITSSIIQKKLNVDLPSSQTRSMIHSIHASSPSSTFAERLQHQHHLTQSKHPEHEKKFVFHLAHQTPSLNIFNNNLLSPNQKPNKKSFILV